MTYTRASVQSVLTPSPAAEIEAIWPSAAPTEVIKKMQAKMRAPQVPAAVLVPLIQRPEGLHVLLTERAANLQNHAGQVSFPGGRIEPDDLDPWHAALREAEEEIGLNPRHVEFGGYLPDHWVVTGFRVTPVVGFVDRAFSLSIDQAEVREAFEVPLRYIFDPKNHRPRMRTYEGVEFEIYDIPYGDRNIWGATAGMLMTLRRLLQSASSV
jgi:8-oxo-dGTP pyrophosphatase MutT (NUDIX family)